MIQQTLVILKPCTIQRALIGEVITRFERKGLKVVGLKMLQLSDEVLSEHYAHLSNKPFFQRVKNSMMASPVIIFMSVAESMVIFGPIFHVGCFRASAAVTPASSLRLMP